MHDMFSFRFIRPIIIGKHHEGANSPSPYILGLWWTPWIGNIEQRPGESPSVVERTVAWRIYFSVNIFPISIWCSFLTPYDKEKYTGKVNQV